MLPPPQDWSETIPLPSPPEAPVKTWEWTSGYSWTEAQNQATCSGSRVYRQKTRFTLQVTPWPPCDHLIRQAHKLTWKKRGKSRGKTKVKEQPHIGQACQSQSLISLYLPGELRMLPNRNEYTEKFLKRSSAVFIYLLTQLHRSLLWALCMATLWHWKFQKSASHELQLPFL